MVFLINGGEWRRSTHIRPQAERTEMAVFLKVVVDEKLRQSAP